MTQKRALPLTLVLMITILIQIACVLPTIGSSPKQTEPAAEEETPKTQAADGLETPETEIDTPDQPTPKAEKPPKKGGPPTPTPYIYQGEAPAAGTGGVYGRLLWNGKPVEGVEVKLCDEIKFLKGCIGKEYPALTDTDGIYVILDVPPGKYGLTFRALDSDTWYYITSSVLNAKDFEILSDQMMDVGDHLTVRTDLIILTPKEDERLTVARPTLTWETYPGAAYYELTFHAGRGGSLIGRMKLTETSFTLDRDLQTCDYSFTIEAFNDQEERIAENDGWRNFVIGGLPQSCKMVALTPAKGATVSAKNITLTWQPHDWAAVYKIHMYKKDDSKLKILDFVETSKTEYVITQDVPAGVYQWVVYAYDAFGDNLGFTDTFILNVTSP